MLDLKEKKLIVTGGAGFLGNSVVNKLREAGAENIYVPRSRIYDLRKRDIIEAMFDMNPTDIIIHLAANVGGIGYNLENPATLFYDNLTMGTQLIDEANHRGIEKFVSAITVCAYPKFASVPFKEDEIWNGYPEETNAPYGLAKKMLIVQSQAYRQQFGFNAISLIPVNLYGPGDNFDPKSSHVIPALIRRIDEAITNNDTLSIWGTGNASREFLYVEDAAEGIVKALFNYNKPEPVNLGSGKEIKIMDLVHNLCNIMNYKGEIKWNHSKPDGQLRRCLDVSRARDEFGFEAKTDLNEGLRNTVDWWREHGKLS